MDLQQSLRDSVKIREEMLNDAQWAEVMQNVSASCVKSLQNGGKLLFCGNGGSAADAQHLAAELSGRFAYDRPPLFAEALHVNSSYMTAVANDYSFDEVYARLLRAMGRKGDVLLAFSTSGNSPNILKAAEAAREQGMVIVAFTGNTGGKLKELCDWLIAVPSTQTARIREVHITLGHILRASIEETLFPK